MTALTVAWAGTAASMASSCRAATPLSRVWRTRLSKQTSRILVPAVSRVQRGRRSMWRRVQQKVM